MLVSGMGYLKQYLKNNWFKSNNANLSVPKFKNFKILYFIGPKINLINLIPIFIACFIAET